MYYPYNSYHSEYHYYGDEDPSKYRISPPEWAVEGKGESQLIPVGCTADSHNSIDLTLQRWYRIGRSPMSDIPLLHATSSRSHALIFHHCSGACYIMDTNSVHGTFVDGIKIKSHPYKIRRGALIRFGGSGAPTFILKSFSNEFHGLVRDLSGVANSVRVNLISESSSTEEDEQPPQQKSHYFRHPQHWIHHVHSRKHSYQEGRIFACIRGDGGGVACMSELSEAPYAALVLLNTRLNALGEIGCSDRRLFVQKTIDHMTSLAYNTRKRSILQDSTSNKRHKSIPDLTILPTFSHSSSQDSIKRTTRVRFSDKNQTFYPPSVTPDDVSLDDGRI